MFQIQVILQDVNDNPPEFSASSYDIEVLESLSPGQVVLSVTATDNDATREEIVYSMEDSQLFSIDPTTGTYDSNSMTHYERIVGYDVKTFPVEM